MEPRRRDVAHRGITVADVPNLFFLLGPNTGLGHNSMVFMIEAQIGTWPTPSPLLTRRAPWRWRRPAPRRTGSTKSCRTTCRHGVDTGGCHSWYLDAKGVNRSLWSGLASEYWMATREFKPAEYKFFGVGLPLLPSARIAGDTNTSCCVAVVVAPQG